MTESEDHDVEVTGGRVSRRGVLGGAVAGGVAVGAGVDPAAAAPVRGLPSEPRTQGTTLAQTLVKGEKGKGGYRKIVVGPGEPHLLRRELAKGAPRTRPAGATRRPLLAMGQLTDCLLYTSDAADE